jgi:hypothetical protein
MKIDTISFENVQAYSCDDTHETIYKLNGNEALFVKIPAIKNAFANDVSTVPFSIGGDISVTYRAYNGTVTAANLCDSPSPITPNATEEWVATSGTIVINTIAIYSAPDATTGATRITKYVHNIVFKNIVFLKPSGEQIYETFAFGDYNTTPTSLSLSFTPANIQICPANNLLYNVNGLEALYIQNLDPTLLATTDLGVPKKKLLSTTTNKLVYRLFKTAIIDVSHQDYFCSTSFPTLPEVNEEWIGNNGVENVSGIIEVTTTQYSTGVLLHTIRLKGVTFQKGNSTFYYGDDILYGKLFTAN